MSSFYHIINERNELTTQYRAVLTTDHSHHPGIVKVERRVMKKLFWAYDPVMQVRTVFNAIFKPKKQHMTTDTDCYHRLGKMKRMTTLVHESDHLKKLLEFYLLEFIVLYTTFVSHFSHMISP